MLASLPAEEVGGCKPALDESEVYQPPATTDVAEQPTETVDAIERWVDLEPDARARGQQTSELGARLVCEAFAFVALRCVNLQQPHARAARELDRIPVDHERDLDVLDARRLYAAADKRRHNAEQDEH